MQPLPGHPREKQRVIWAPSLHPPPNTESWQFYSLDIPLYLPLLSVLSLLAPGRLLTGLLASELTVSSLFLQKRGQQFFFCQGQHFWLCGPNGLHHDYSTLPLQCESSTDNMQKNECGCDPTKLYLQRQVEGEICPTGHSWLAPALHWDQSDLFKSQVTSCSLSCLKAFSASPSAPGSSQSLVDLAPCQLSHWRLHYGPCIICGSVLFAIPRTRGSICQCHTFVHLSPQPRKLLIFLPPSFWGCCSSL